MALTNATTLADYGAGIGTQGAALTVDATNKRVGVGTDAPAGPEGSLQVGTGITFFGNTGIISATGGRFSGDFNVAGALTFEDVTNIDSLGFGTFRSGLTVQGAGSTTTTLSVSGVSTFTGAINGNVTGNISGGTVAGSTGTFTGDVDIADKIVHTGDTNTAIRFPAADTITAETGGSERVRIDSSGRLLVGSTSARANFFNGSTDPHIQLEGVDTPASTVASIRCSDNAGSPRFLMGKSRGSSVGSNTIVQNNDDLGEISFQGSDGTQFVQAADIRVEVDGTPGADDMPGRIVFGTTADGAASPTERLRIDSSGNIGVNQTSINSSRKMEITQPSSYTSGLRINSAGSSGNGAYFEVFVGSANYKFGGDHGTNALLFRKDGTEYMRHDSGGRLLINTTTSRIVEDSVGNGPQGKIQIEATNSDAIMSIISAGTADVNRCGTINLGRHRNSTVGGTPTVVQNGDALGSIVFSGGDGTDMRTRGATIIASVDGSPGSNDMPGRLVFSTRADGGGMSERLRITSAGNVLIGTDDETGNTDRLLQVGDVSRSSSYIEIRTSTSGASGVVFSDNDDGSGTTGYRGTIEYAHSTDQLQFKTAGVTRLTCTSSGDFTATGNVTAYSDISLKENIETIPNALDKVLNLRGVEFDRIDKEDNTHEIGVIAQEVEEVIPEVVLTNTEGIKSVAYGNLVGLLIESIKELKAEVNDLKAQVEG